MNEKTLVLVKPDGIRRNLVAEIIRRLEESGALKVIARRRLTAAIDEVRRHFPSDPEWPKQVAQGTINGAKKHGVDLPMLFGTNDPQKISEKIIMTLFSYYTEGQIEPMIVEGENAILAVRKIVGATRPDEAEQGTIRGDLGYDTPEIANLAKRALRNVVHASATPEEAKSEIEVWFPGHEVMAKEPDLQGLIREFAIAKTKRNWREAAEVAYVLARLFQKDGDEIEAYMFSGYCLGCLEHLPQASLSDCVSSGVMRAGVLLPGLLHEGTVSRDFPVH